MKAWIFLIRADPACINYIKPESKLLTKYVFPSPLRCDDLQEVLYHASIAFGHAEGNTLPRGILCLYGGPAMSTPVPITKDTFPILCAILGGVEIAYDDDDDDDNRLQQRQYESIAFKATDSIVIRMVLTMEPVLEGGTANINNPRSASPHPSSYSILNSRVPEAYEVYKLGHTACAQPLYGTPFQSRPTCRHSPAHARPISRCNEPNLSESARLISLPTKSRSFYIGEGVCRTSGTTTPPSPSFPVQWKFRSVGEPQTTRSKVDVSMTQREAGTSVACKARRGVGAMTPVGEQRCFEARGPRPLLQVLGVLERSAVLTAELFAALLLQFMPTIYQRVQKKVGKINKSSLNFTLSWFNPNSQSGMQEALRQSMIIMEQDSDLYRHAGQLKDILSGRPGAPKIGTLLVDCLRTFSEFPFAAQAHVLILLAPHLLPVWRKVLSWCSTTGADDADPGQVTLSEITHWNYDCAACGTRNIYGPRFRCDSCHNRYFDLCGPCYLRKHELHDNSHLFRCLFRDVRHIQPPQQQQRAQTPSRSEDRRQCGRKGCLSPSCEGTTASSLYALYHKDQNWEEVRLGVDGLNDRSGLNPDGLSHVEQCSNFLALKTGGSGSSEERPAQNHKTREHASGLTEVLAGYLSRNELSMHDLLSIPLVEDESLRTLNMITNSRVATKLVEGSNLSPASAGLAPFATEKVLQHEYWAKKF